MNVMTGLERAWVDVMIFVPRFVGFLFTLLIGYFVSAWLGKAVTKILNRVGFDCLVERGGIRAALEKSGSSPSQIAGKLTFYTLFLFVLQLGFGFFGPNPISGLINQFIVFLPNIFVAMAILVISAWVASAVKDIVQATLGGLNYGRIL